MPRWVTLKLDQILDFADEFIPCIVQHRLVTIDSRMAELQRVRDGLTQLVEACPGRGAPEQCPLLRALSDEDTPVRAALRPMTRDQMAGRKIQSGASRWIRMRPGMRPVCRGARALRKTFWSLFAIGMLH